MKEYEVEITGKHLVQRFVPIEEQYKRFQSFRRIRKDGHLITLGFADKLYDSEAPKHRIYELVSIWHPLDPKYKCTFRQELLATSQLKRLIKDEIAKGGIVKDVYRYWLAQPKPEIPPEKKEEFPEYRKVAEFLDKSIYGMTFEELLREAEKGIKVEEVDSEFDGMVDEEFEEIGNETEEIDKLRNLIAKREKEIKRTEEKLKKAKEPEDKELYETNLTFLRGHLSRLQARLAKLEKTLLKEKIKPEVETEFKKAIKPILKRHEDALKNIKSIIIKPTEIILGKESGIEFKWRAITPKHFVVILSGLLPKPKGRTFTLERFTVAIKGGQPAAKFVANLHNCLLKLREKAKDTKLIAYLDSISNKNYIDEVSRQHWLRDIKIQASQYIGSLRNYIWKNLPQPYPEDLIHPDNWTIQNLLSSKMPEYSKEMAKVMEESGFNKPEIQKWLKSIGYEDTVKWTKGTDLEIEGLTDIEEIEEETEELIDTEGIDDEDLTDEIIEVFHDDKTDSKTEVRFTKEGFTIIGE